MFNVKKIIVSTLSKTDGLIRCATYNMAGNGKAPDSRTGIVLKSGAKVLRYFEIKIVRSSTAY